MEMIPFDFTALRRYLEKMTAPVAESILLKETAGLDYLPRGHEELFVLHFSLYHLLYLLKTDAGADQWYLHLDPMRIRLLPVPGPDRCHRYYPEEGVYCRNGSAASLWCAEHGVDGEASARAFSFDPMREFYINPENISFGGSDLLKKQMRGVMIYAFKKGEIERALAFFGLVRPTRLMIRKRYHELAKEYHPDRNGSDDRLMKRLNQSYQVLCEVFIV